MVCLGNICRSPLAQGILQTKCDSKGINWHIDSAGTSGWHNGEQPDIRSIEIAKLYNIDISGQRSRQLSKEDLTKFDLILAMDSSNFNNILKLTGSDEEEAKVKLILNYVFPNENRAVPDPYYDNSFDRVYGLLDTACDRILEEYIN